MQATVKPDFDELAPPDDVYGLTRRAAVASAPFTQVLTTTDSVLSQKGGIENLKIYRELLRDDQVASTWGQRRLGLTSCETVVEPGADDALSKAAAEELQAQIEAMAWDDITDKALYSAFYGWGVSEVMWRPDGNRVAFDRIVVRDRARFRFDINGALYLWQDGAYRLMPERKFWVMRNGGDHHDEPYGLGIANALYWPVFFKRNDIKFWLMFLEKFGMPTAQAKIPAGQMSDPVLVNQAKAVLKNIATDAGVVVPDSLVIELIEATRSGTADYGGMLEAMNGAISKIVVGQTMTTDNGSSRSQGEVHERVAQAIKEADSDLLCGSFNLGPVKWWTEWNFPGAKPPRVYRHTAPPEDMAKRAERDTKIVGLGYEPTEDYIKETYGEGWVKKAQPTVPKAFGQQPPGDMQFAEGEHAALAALRAARRLDQDALVEAATAMAEQYQTITGRRVGQLLHAAEFSEDYDTFRRKLDELLAEAPPPETQAAIAKTGFFASLMGALRGQRNDSTADFANPYHDARGRFATKGGANFVSMFGRPKGGEGGGSRPSIQDGHERLSSPLKIKRETEKAVGVENAQVISARATAKYDVKELSGSQIELLRSGAGDISWLPKSQISVHNGEVHGMAGWLAQKHGFRTEEGAAKREKAFEAGKKRYSELLKQAKDAGVKGVREGMRTATIKQKMMDAGVPVSFSEDDEGLDIMCGNFEFGQP